MGRYRLTPGRLVACFVLLAVGAICGYLTAVIGTAIYDPRDCTVSACTGLDERAWPAGFAGALIGGIAYTTLGLAAGLPRRRQAEEPSPDMPGGTERVTATLTHLSLFASLPVVGPVVVALVAGRTAPFLRRHAVAAARLHLWQILLIFPIFFFAYPTIGSYLLVALTALFGGIAYAIIGAVRAASGKVPAYPADWPPCSRPRTDHVTVQRREHRSRLALFTFVAAVAANLLRLLTS